MLKHKPEHKILCTTLQCRTGSPFQLAKDTFSIWSRGRVSYGVSAAITLEKIGCVAWSPLLCRAAILIPWCIQNVASNFNMLGPATAFKWVAVPWLKNMTVCHPAITCWVTCPIVIGIVCVVTGRGCIVSDDEVVMSGNEQQQAVVMSLVARNMPGSVQEGIIVVVPFAVDYIITCKFVNRWWEHVMQFSQVYLFLKLHIRKWCMSLNGDYYQGC